MRQYRLYLQDILQAIENIEDFITGMDFESFKEDTKTTSAVIRQFEIMGEASKQIPSDVREQYSHVPWSELARMRDKLIHGYFQVNYRTVWNTIRNDLPSLKEQVLEVLEKEGR